MNRLVFTILMVLASFHAKAQVYSSEACFYIEAGEDISYTEYVCVLLFKNSTLYIGTSANNLHKYILSLKSRGEIVNKGKGLRREWGGVTDFLKEDPNYYDKLPNYRTYFNSCIYEYDSSLSTSKREVYKHVTDAYYSPFHQRRMEEEICYIAVAPDKSSVIFWVETGGRISYGRTYYTRIEKDDLIGGKAINRDFLYE